MCFGGYPRSVCLLCNYLPLRAEPELLLLDERLLLEPEENEPTERLTLLAPLLLLDEKELLERLLELLLDEELLLDDEVLRLELRLVTLLSDEELLFDEELVRFTTLTFLSLLLEAFALEELLLLLLFLTVDEPREVELLTLLPPTATAPPRDEEVLPLPTMVLPPPRITSLDTLLGLLGVAELPLATISFLAFEALCSSKR